MSDVRPAARSRLTHLALVVISGFLAFLAPSAPARAQGAAAGEAGGIPESGSLSLANALASAALDPSSGVLTASLPFDLPAARGSAQAGLALTYNSAAGIREAGIGWGLALPSIERSTIDGPPRYYELQHQADQVHWLGWMDHFTFGGQPLVPVCRVMRQECVAGSRSWDDTNPVAEAGPLPVWATAGWMYFRLETDSSRARFYLSPNFRSWRVQFAGGEILELGEPLVQPYMLADPLDAAIDYDAVRNGSAPVQRYPFRWNPVRRYDAQTQNLATNLVVYRWARLGSRQRGFLTDVFDTPSATLPPDTKELTAADFAHHAKLSWNAPPFLAGLPRRASVRPRTWSSHAST